MNERKSRGDRAPERRPAESVRIIRADEAQAALEAGEAAGRRPDDELRFGDRPPAPQGPRPPHRFPLPDSVDPAGAVPRPRLAVPMRSDERGGYIPPERYDEPEPFEGEDTDRAPDEGPQPSWGDQPAASTSPSWEPPAEEWGLGDRTAEMETPVRSEAGPEEGFEEERPYGQQHLYEPEPPGESPSYSGASTYTPGDAESYREAESESYAEEPVAQSPLAMPEEGITVSGGGTDLPHWTDPPTGEVPKILIGESPDDPTGEDDLEAWNALGSRGIRWRDEAGDWSDSDEIGDLAGDDVPVGALDQSRSEHSDMFSFDEEFERIEAERTSSGSVPIPDFEKEPEPEPATARVGSHARHSRQAAHSPAARTRTPTTSGPSDEDLGSRVVVGLALIILLAIAYAIGPKALVVYAAAVVVAAAAEAYGMLQKSGFRPATLLGLVATAGVMFGAYWKGLPAIPLSLVLVFVGAMMWYLMRIVEARPLANVAVTTMGFVWVAVMGAFAPVMLRAHHGKGLFLGAVIVAVVADVAAFVVGRWLGSRPIAASVSPSKTVEGFIGGLVFALIAGAIVGKELVPWGGMKHGLLLGLVVGLVAPAGDLFESMIKRDLGLKDSGGALPGHGGLLDRFDSLLIVLPAAYYLATLFSIVK